MVMILSFRISRSWQTVYTQIRLVLQDLSDEGLHCLPFFLQRMEVHGISLLQGHFFSNFRVIKVIIEVSQNYGLLNMKLFISEHIILHAISSVRLLICYHSIYFVYSCCEGAQSNFL